MFLIWCMWAPLTSSCELHQWISYALSHIFVLLLMYLCVGSTNFLLWGVLVGPSYFYIGVCFEVCEASRHAPRAVSGDLASFMLVYVVTCICMVVIVRCVRSTDLHLLLCRWSLMLSIHMLWCVRVLPIGSGAVSVDLSRIISLLYLLWCVWGLPTCTCHCVGGPLMHHFICCEVHRPAPGRCRWVSHIYCFVVVCVRSTDLPVGCVGGSLMHRLIYCIWCDVCEVCRLLLGCVGGPLMHHLVCYGVCEVYRPAPGLCRWVSHFSHFNIFNILFCCDMIMVAIFNMMFT